MFKRVLAFILIFTTISVLFGQDLHSQLNNLNDKFNINIQENIKSAINDFLRSFTDDISID